MPIRKKKRKGSGGTEVDAAAQTLADFMHNHGRPVGKQAKKRAKQIDIEKAIATASECGRTGDWSKAGSSELVGLYALFHKEVYGVEAEDLKTRSEFQAAKRVASRFLREAFDHDADAAAHFMQWIWLREQKREDYANTRGFTRSRLAYRFCFSSAAKADYLVDQKRGR